MRKFLKKTALGASTALAIFAFSSSSTPLALGSSKSAPSPKYISSFKGSLLSTQGSPVSGGTVDVLAYRNLNQKTASQSQQMVSVGTGEISADGHFDVSIDPKRVKQQGVIVQPGGNLAVTVIARMTNGDASIVPGGAHTADGGKSFVFNGPSPRPGQDDVEAAPAPTNQAAPLARSSSQDESAVAGISPDGQSVTLRAHHFSRERVAALPSRSTVAHLPAQDTPTPSATPYGPQKKVSGILGSVSATTGDHKFSMQFAYAHGGSSSTEVGVGMAYEGDSYKQSRTQSVSGNVETTFPLTSDVGRRLYRGTFIYQEYQVYNDYMAWVEMRPVGYAGGGSSTLGGATPFTKCISMDPGMKNSYTSSEATSWANGLSVGSMLNGNVSLTTQSGYSKTVNITIQNGSIKHSLCGNTAYPQSAGSLQVRS